MQREPAKRTRRICIGERCVKVELADTKLKCAFGLMLRAGLKHDEGMLFVFKKEASVPIWMFGMRFPLDIVWLDTTKQVVHIEQNARPWRDIFWPSQRAKYVLELCAGQVKVLEIQKGTQIDYAE